MCKEHVNRHIQSLACVLRRDWQNVKQQNARVMKISKLILSIALVALTTTLFGRLGEPEADCNCCPPGVFMDQDLSLENWMATPFDANFESELLLEGWMNLPFEVGMDSDLTQEYWMLLPFDREAEAELFVEAWMTSPFKTVEEPVVEQWMAASWF